MATTTFQPYTGNGSNKTFNYSFPTFTASEVVVEVDGVVVDNYTIPGYQTTGTRTVTFDNSTGTLNTDLCESDGAPKNNLEVIVRRDTNIDFAKASYTAGSSLKASDLTDNNTQILRALQEEQNTPTTTPRIRDQAITSAKIKNLTIVDEDISATAEIEVYKLKDGAANQVLVTQNDGTTVNWTSNVDLPGTLDVTGNVDFDSNLNVDGTTTLDGTTIDGVLDVNGSATIDNVEINGNVIDTTSGNLNIDSAGGTTTIDDNLAVTGTLNVTQGITLQNATATLNGSQIVTETASQTLTNKTLTTPVINDLSGTAVVTSGTSSSDNKVYSAKRAGEIFYGKGTVEEIQSGETWAAADDKVATTAAIDARIIDLVDDVGGFVPIANELSFPNANPDVNNGAGTLVSIKALSTAYTSNNSGTFTIANGTVGNSTVTVNGATANTTFASGFGMILETTTTLNTYNFHRLVPKATEVTTVAANATQVGTVHTNITQVQTVHNNISNINAVAADATDIGAVAAKATEIGRLGTADAVADMAILGTTDVVADMNLLATNDVVADMNMLATSDVVADMNMLAVSDVISDMNDLATSGNITAMSTCSTNIASINSAAANLASAANFGDQYQVAANNPSTDGGGNALAEGDLYFNTSANELKVYNGSAWQSGVTATGNFATVTGNTFTGDNRYNDNVKALFGTGSDLEIYHSAHDSYIKDVGTGHLFIEASHTLLRSSGGENQIKLHENGSVELYYDNSKKLETASDKVMFSAHAKVSADATYDLGASGARWNNLYIANDIDIKDDGKLLLGDSDDLQIYHDGNTSYVSNTTNTGLLIRNLGNGDIKIKPQNSYPVELYYNGVKKFETTSQGVNLEGNGSDHHILDLHNTGSGKGSQIKFRNDHEGGAYIGLRGDTTGDLRAYTEKNFKIEHGGNTNLKSIPAGGVELYHNGSKKFETTSGGVTVTGTVAATSYTGDGSNLTGINTDLVSDTSPQLGATLETNGYSIHFDDSTSLIGFRNRIRMGTGEDLQIYHDGSHSYITDNGTGNLYINSNHLNIDTDHGEQMINCFKDGAVELYYNNSKKLETFTSGTKHYGQVYLPTAGGSVQWTGANSNAFLAGMTSGADSPTGSDEHLQFHHWNGSAWEKTFYVQRHNITFPDHNKIQLGDGADFQIYHDGSRNRIDAYGGHSVIIRNTYGVTEQMAVFTPNGPSELMYDGGKKLETTSGGIKVTGIPEFRKDSSDTNFADESAPGANTSGVFCQNVSGVTGNFAAFTAIAHSGNSVGMSASFIAKSHSTGYSPEVYITQRNGGNSQRTAIKITNPGAVELNYSGTKKLETASDKINFHAHAKVNDDNTYDLGASGARWKDLYLSNDIYFKDNGAVSLGNSGDALLYHSGSSFHLVNNTGNLHLNGNSILIKNKDNDESYIRCTDDDSVKLYYNNSEKFRTVSTGSHIPLGRLTFANDNAWYGEIAGSIQQHSNYLYFIIGSNGGMFRSSGGTDRMLLDSSGNLRPAANNQYDLGTSSYRWKNIYTNDLNLSNEGSSNDVDGTWGNWTIQEGESDLFLKNNRSGKKYKFNLTEIS